ncbi:ankyrin repeat domain-containing protein 17-like isoform X2 [Sycon ciliatum]|uniref:ankyrin repeat domain-containing protein 17-like isoform X2 n=1 Tax=Sycon ciliatum TaxID=27933 RepID=UPI0031F66E28
MHDEEPAGAVPGTPVNHSFFQLRITGYTASSEEVGTSYLTDMFRSMCNDNSCVGPWGVTIGSSKGCEVYLPQLTQVQPKHARIEWRSSNPNPTSTPPSADGGRARLTLQDLSGGGRFWISCQPECSQSVKMIVWCDVTKRQRAEPLREPVELCWGVKFGVGNVLFQVFEFSPLELARKCLFGAVRNNDVAVLSAMLDAAKEPNGLEGAGSSCPLALLQETSAESPARRLDLDIREMQRCPSFVEDDGESAWQQQQYGNLFPRGLLKRNRPLDQHAENRLAREYLMARECTLLGLLEIAVGQSNLEIVSLLLSEGIKMCGSPLRTAVRHDCVAIAQLLLKNGARTVDTCSPEYAKSHKMRQLLLNVPLLCSAAEVGDVDEVRRLLACNTPPNGIGLGNKNSLHFACMSGHAEVVKLLLDAGATANIKGGSQQRTALHYAALSGCVEVAQCLLEAGAKEDIRDSLGFTALNLSDTAEMCNLLKNAQSPSLCIAAQGGDIAMARQLLEDDGLRSDEKLVLINQRNEKNHAAIHLACVAGNIEFIQLLLLHGTNDFCVNMPGGSGEWTPLMFASVAGKAATVEYLLSVGVNVPTQEDERGSPPFSSTICTAQDLITKALKSVQQENNSLQDTCKCFHMSSTPVSKSCFESSTGTVLSAPLIAHPTGAWGEAEQRRWLVRRRVQLEAVLDVLQRGSRQLQEALNQKDLETARSLLENGVVSAQCAFSKPKKESALWYACHQGLTEFAELLLDHGALLAGTGDYEGGYNTSAHVACNEGHVETLRLLLDRGQDVNSRLNVSTGFNTLLHTATLAGHAAIVQLLLDRGADRELHDNAGNKPLLAQGPQSLVLEVCAGSVDGVRRRLDSGGGVSREDLVKLCENQAQGMNPVHVAIQNDHLDVLRVLVDAGCDVNAKAGPERETPLHLASRKGLQEIVRYLLEHGATVHLLNSHGKTALEVADGNPIRRILVEQHTLQIEDLPDFTDDIPDDNRCRVCMAKPVNTILLPCGHKAFCFDCAGRLETCALDRKPINRIIRIDT